MSAQPRIIATPVPVVDHVVVNVQHGMETAAETYRRLGFSLTPLGRHTLGSINHLAMFGADYLELLGLPEGSADRMDVLAWPQGLTGLAFATEDADAVHGALAEARLPVLPVLGFSRPVMLQDGPHGAAFRVVRLAPDAAHAGRLFFCQHLTRGLVWRDEWRRHPNGALGIAGMVIAAEQPAQLADLFRTMFGEAAMRPLPHGARLLAGLASIDVLPSSEVARRYGAAAPRMQGRPAVMAVLRLRTADVALAATAIRAAGVPEVQESEGRVLVPADSAVGIALEFVA